MRHNPGIRIKDVDHYLAGKTLKPGSVVILTQGRGHGGGLENPGPGILQVEDETVTHLQKQGLEVLVCKTAKAIENFNKLMEEKREVFAFIHTTC